MPLRVGRTLVRKEELIPLINCQYHEAEPEGSNNRKVNSVVLLKNIANESKREPMKLARIIELHKSSHLHQCRNQQGRAVNRQTCHCGKMPERMDAQPFNGGKTPTV